MGLTRKYLSEYYASDSEVSLVHLIFHSHPFGMKSEILVQRTMQVEITFLFHTNRYVKN